MERWIGHLIQRRVAVSSVYVLVAVLAGVALLRLPVSLLPPIKNPSLVVWTAYPDVPPGHLEKTVTQPIENLVATARGLQRVSSRSQLGGSLVRADFGWSTDLESATLDLRQQLDRLGPTLPEGTGHPVVLAVDPSKRPILVLAVGARSNPVLADPQELIALKRVAEDVLVRRIEQVEGVARVQVAGGRDREIQIRILPEKLAAHRLDISQVVQALQAANLSLAGGSARRGAFLHAVEVRGEFRDLADIEATRVSVAGQPPIRLRDIARVEDGVARQRGLVRYGEGEVLLLLVERRPEANTVRTATAIHEVLAATAAELPELGLDVVIDESVFIEAAIGGSARAVVWGGLLAIVVLFVFVRRRVSLLAVALAVPLSIAVALILFDLLGVSLNLISLSGLALGIGLLVDNTIVVVENVARWRDQGVEPALAARRGAAEVGPAITASTLTTVAVFGPLMFTEGLAGQLFRDQSLAVVCSLGASLLVALTLVPVILSRDARRRGDQGVLGPLAARYETLLGASLRHKGSVLVGVVLFLGLASYIAVGLLRENVPTVGQDRLEVRLEMGAESELDLLDQRATSLRETLATWPEVQAVLTDLGERDEHWLEVEPRPVHRGDLTLLLVPEARDRAISDRVAQRVRELPLEDDLSVSVHPVRTQLEALLVRDEADLLIDLYSDRRSEAHAAVDDLLSVLDGRPELTNVSRSLESVAGVRLHLDREAMQRFGVAAGDLEAVLEGATRGVEATQLSTVNSKVPMVVRSGAGLQSIDEVLAQQVRTAKGFLPLTTFLTPQRVRLSAVLERNQQAPIVRVNADLAPGTGIQEALLAVKESFESALPTEVRGLVHGSGDVFDATLAAAGRSLALSVVIVYLILVAQFESLVQPLVILSTVPLAVGGVAIALWGTGQSWNLMSLTGCVVLVGIAVNDAILKVDFINQRRRAGLPLTAAIREAGRERLRPIVMTTVTTVLGLLPMAIGSGQGAGLRAPLAIAVIGGLAFTTFFTLTAIPTFYAGLERWGALGSNHEGLVNEPTT